MATQEGGIRVQVCDGAPALAPDDAVEVNVGSDVPVALHGLKKVLWVVRSLAADLARFRCEANAAEWNVIFPEDPIPGRNLFEIADAPNQRRLFRESEQTFRVLNFAARILQAGLAAIGRPMILLNAGACDLVSIRGLMHAVQCSRLERTAGLFLFANVDRTARHASSAFEPTRAEQLERAWARMRAERVAGTRTVDARPLPRAGGSLESEYLEAALDEARTLEHRVAAALLAVRACFFSTNHEGAALAIETGLALLAPGTSRVRPLALLSAWDALDDARLDIPMLELDRSAIVDGEHARAQLLIHMGVIQVFTGDAHGGVATFGRALDCAISPELASDVRLYRALATTKMLGDLRTARAEIELGLAAVRGRPTAQAKTCEAWLHNLMALTHFQEKHLDEAEREEELSLSCIDNAAGPSAAHLKTNLVSNFSVVFEARGDFVTATKVWKSFAGLNAKLKSDAADKVYLNRLGALQREAGDLDAAATTYRAAFEKAEATGDRFHGEIIASAIARLYLDRAAEGDGERAAGWYRTAAARARYCGDCVAFARDLAGLEVASGSDDFAAARAALAHDTTHEREAESLRVALASGDRDAVLRELPRAKSKLSRPFAVVNL
jgi:tetratricopeptide (TPR) repeat protein